MMLQGTSVVQAVSLKIKVAAGIKLHMYWFVLEVRINSSENETWQLIIDSFSWNILIEFDICVELVR